MKEMRHDKVVQLYGNFVLGSDLWIVLEFCSGGSVQDIMRTCGRVMTEAEIGPIVRETLLGLKYLHDQRAWHRSALEGPWRELETDDGRHPRPQA